MMCKRADLHLGKVTKQPAEDAGVAARDAEDLVSLQVKWLFRSSTSISTGATRTLNVFSSRETAGWSSISMDRIVSFED